MLMHRRHKHDILVVLSLVGFADSVYLATAHYLGFQVPCDITRGCETVLSSKFASLLGLPLSVWGMAFYTAVIVLCLLANHYQVCKRLLTWFLVLGSALAAAFLFLQFFVIKQVCQYCLLADLLTVVLLLVDLNIEHKGIEQN
jgi:uncharacterized membrane protein